jgi:hypothetical protein
MLLNHGLLGGLCIFLRLFHLRGDWSGSLVSFAALTALVANFHNCDGNASENAWDENQSVHHGEN